MNIFKSIDNLNAGLRRYKDRSLHVSVKNLRISGWSVGQHIEHILRANIIGAKLLTRPPERQETLKPHGFFTTLVLFFGVIPRGKAKAPERVQPTLSDFSNLPELFTEAEAGFAEIQDHSEDIQQANHLISHPVLGGLRPREWLRFMEIHQTHHDKIITDILLAENISD